MRVKRLIVSIAWTGLVLQSLPSAAAEPDVANAVKRKDAAAARALIARKADVTIPQADGTTALHWAAHWGDLETAQALVGAGSEVNAVTELGVPPLWIASYNGDTAMVDLLLKAGAQANAVLPNGETVLMRAARTGNVDVVKLLTARGADPNAAEPSQQQTAIMWGVAEQHPEVVRVLVAHGANVHARSKSGFTPLLFAARAGDRQSAEILVSAGASVNDSASARLSGGPSGAAQGGGNMAPEPGSGSASALLIATVRGHTALAMWLLDRGADPDAAGLGYTALHWAAGTWETDVTGSTRGISPRPGHEWNAMAGLPAGKLELVKALLAHGADPNARLVKEPVRVGFTRNQLEGRSWVGATLFVLAARSAEVAVMQTLLDAGADPGIPTAEKTTALMAAAGVGRINGESWVTDEQMMPAVELALKVGNDINAVDDIGDTALHGAARIRSDRLVQFLATNGAKLDVENFDGDTPLMIAESTQQYRSKNVSEQTSTGNLLRKLGAKK